MKVRLWIDADTVKQCLTEDGNLVLTADELFFFKRNEISNEDGWHAEFASPEGGFELHIPYYDFQCVCKQVSKYVLDKAQAQDYN